MKKLFFYITHPEITVFPYALSSATSLTTALLNIRFFYFVLLYLAFTRITQWQHYLYASIPDPLWPIAWIRFTDIETAYMLILSLFFIGTFFAAVFPFNRVCRLLAFVGFFQYAAYLYSFGKIDHPWHIAILTAFVFIFLPTNKKENNNPSFSKNLLLIFWFAQTFTLLTYSMSGLWKVWGIVEQAFKGEMYALLPQAMALHIADRLLSTNQSSLLGPWLIEHYWWGWLLLPAGIFIEFFSLYIAFRPNVHKIWGVLLILLHIGNFFVMAIPFRDTILLLAILFLNSPFEKPDTSWKQRLADFPVVGVLTKRFLTQQEKMFQV